MRRLDALVVVDVVENELSELATHVLPATGELERTDVSMFSHNSVHAAIQSTGPVVAPVAERRPVWWALGQVAARAGVDLLRGADPDALTDELYLRGILDHSPLDADAVFAAGSRAWISRSSTDGSTNRCSRTGGGGSHRRAPHPARRPSRTAAGPAALAGA